MKKLSVAVFISGTGSNLKAIIDACNNPDFPVAVSVVLSNKADALGLNHARDNDIPFIIVEHRDFKKRQDFEKEIIQELSQYNIDLICLAGFMRVLSTYFFENWHKEIINIHPSLLPSFKGASAIDDAFSAGVTETGCTVHYVIPEIDAGEIITQRKVKILAQDDLEALKQKIHKEEYIAYIEALETIANSM